MLQHHPYPCDVSLVQETELRPRERTYYITKRYKHIPLLVT